MLLSVAPLDVVISGAEPTAAASSDGVFAFFFLADFDSDLADGFWVTTAAIATIAKCSLEVRTFRCAFLVGSVVLDSSLAAELGRKGFGGR